MNIVIYNHSRYLNIAFWGVVLGELISLAHQRFDDLSGCLSGDHLEMTFANGSSSVSLDIVSDGKMTGTIEGDEVTLHFTTQHS